MPWLLAVVVALTLASTNQALADPRDSQIASLGRSIYPGEWPSYLPDHYAQHIHWSPKQLQLVKRWENNGGVGYEYSALDGSFQLSVVNFDCDPTGCNTVFDRTLAFTDGQATKAGGRFTMVAPDEYAADWSLENGRIAALGFRLPNAFRLWTIWSRDDFPGAELYREALQMPVNRDRYERSLKGDNIEIGRWASHSAEYARLLLKAGDKQDAIQVLKKLITWSPSDYDSQLAIAENIDDSGAARTMASVVYKNAEDPAQIGRAATLLGLSAEKEVPVVSPAERGLQVILVVVPPSDPKLLSEAAAVYEGITGIPAKVRRLGTDFDLGRSERSPLERSAQQYILQRNGVGTKFDGWDSERYIAELNQIATRSTALQQYHIAQFVKAMSAGNGQYLGGRLLDDFANALAPYRSNDPRTMYVGVTRSGMYAGTSNFIFSVANGPPSPRASVLSYDVMLAKTLGDPMQSRKRLAERIAKELVPATLKLLDIPRPADPSDPYSYSSSVGALDQKTLSLSPDTRAALDRYR